MKNIIYLSSVSYRNIGNAFIDIGAEKIIKLALTKREDYILNSVNQFPYYISSLGKSISIREFPIIKWIWEYTSKYFGKKFQEKRYKHIKSREPFSILDLAKPDYLIIAGCVLTIPFFKIYYNLLKKVSTSIKIIFLGCSGDSYSDYEISTISYILKDIKPYAIITRDNIAFEKYSSYSKYTYSGIDCAFFVNKLDNMKMALKEPYSVIAFDKIENKRLITDVKSSLKNRVIFASHKPYPITNKKISFLKNGLISAAPTDYLYLYANATEVHSDRIHACIPTLAFGNKCKLYNLTPRKNLFNKIIISKDIVSDLCEQECLYSEQDSMVKYLSSII